MGRIYKRERIWWIRYYRNGKCYPESSRSTEYAVAKNLLRLREGDGAKGVPVTPLMARFTFDEAARGLEQEYAANERRSLETVKRRIKLHLRPFFGGRRMAGITTLDITTYTGQRRAEGGRERYHQPRVGRVEAHVHAGAQGWHPDRVSLHPHVDREQRS